MKYPLYELTWQEFELIVASICEEVLGLGTIIFAAGADGGRDAKFNGTANNFPSRNSCWSGKFIIQAKHTTKVNASCSDTDFGKIIESEVHNIKKLNINNKLDNYLLWTNRKLTGIQDPKIEDYINGQIKINCQILAEERIQKWLQDYPLIAKKHNLDKLLLPLQFYDEDLKEIISLFASTNFSNADLSDLQQSNYRIGIVEKNALNKLSEDYFNNVFKDSINDFKTIEEFFKRPQNMQLANAYINTIRDINAKIVVRRSEFNTFEEIIEYLYDYILSNHRTLKNYRKLIRVFLHYMYFHCDIGINE